MAHTNSKFDSIYDAAFKAAQLRDGELIDCTEVPVPVNGGFLVDVVAPGRYEITSPGSGPAYQSGPEIRKVFVGNDLI